MGIDNIKTNPARKVLLSVFIHLAQEESPKIEKIGALFNLFKEDGRAPEKQQALQFLRSLFIKKRGFTWCGDLLLEFTPSEQIPGLLSDFMSQVEKLGLPALSEEQQQSLITLIQSYYQHPEKTQPMVERFGRLMQIATLNSNWTLAFFLAKQRMENTEYQDEHEALKIAMWTISNENMEMLDALLNGKKNTPADKAAANPYLLTRADITALLKRTREADVNPELSTQLKFVLVQALMTRPDETNADPDIFSNDNPTTSLALQQAAEHYDFDTLQMMADIMNPAMAVKPTLTARNYLHLLSLFPPGEHDGSVKKIRKALSLLQFFKTVDSSCTEKLKTQTQRVFNSLTNRANINNSPQETVRLWRNCLLESCTSPQQQKDFLNLLLKAPENTLISPINYLLVTHLHGSERKKTNFSCVFFYLWQAANKMQTTHAEMATHIEDILFCIGRDLKKPEAFLVLAMIAQARIDSEQTLRLEQLQLIVRRDAMLSICMQNFQDSAQITHNPVAVKPPQKVGRFFRVTQTALSNIACVQAHIKRTHKSLGVKSPDMDDFFSENKALITKTLQAGRATDGLAKQPAGDTATAANSVT